MLSQLPVDVTVGKMLVLGSVLHQMGPTLSAAAALSVQTPLTNRAFRDPDCLVSGATGGHRFMATSVRDRCLLVGDGWV